MTEFPDIQLPDDLLPADGRFGSGPSKVRLEALARLAATGTELLGTSHRRPAVIGLVERLRRGLSDLFSAPPGYEVMVGLGGATAFWDAATFSLIARKSQHVVIGEFSSKFAAAVSGSPHLEEPDVIRVDYGHSAQPVADDDVDAYALIHNETSTGVMNQIVRPASSGLVLVDATSAAGGLPVDPSQFDVYYFSPQKAFGSEGGLWAALCSPAAIERIETVTNGERWIPPFLDLGIALTNSRKNQTYNTPALATLALFVDQVEWMNERGGLDWAVDRCATSASTVYRWAETSDFASPFVSDPAARSATVATVDLDETIPAGVVSGVLRANGIVDTESYRKLGRNQLRVALFPAIDPDDVTRLTQCIDHVVERL
ncbi:MAG: phosphoserine transaminase [Acidimicrobiia bacterium]|nr:phosphoserine transaminase [Acidimicrobiia bacterium]MBT8215081.1 phosphoserine transaminase [Acidimicrobiia bacterium]NNF68362.1 phosphoserine transaminase [Acidimicrobiia bacterium]NNK91593.1 phosphoserine transaminase [Acidimicrobiia bacterium]